MIPARWLKFLENLSATPAAGESGKNESVSAYERFAVPYKFQPNMSVPAAVLAALFAFLRIILGSLIFAFWGAYTIVILNKTGSWVLRGVVTIFSIAAFAWVLAHLLASIARVQRRISGR